jgi:hypothetical protein
MVNVISQIPFSRELTQINANILVDYGTRVVWLHGHQAEEPEVEKSALAALYETGFVAIEEMEAVGLIGQGFEGDGLTDGLLHVVAAGIELGVLARHFDVDRGGFYAPQAALPPFGDHDLFDEIGFDLITRLQADEIGIERFLKAVLRLISEEDSFGGKAVA